MTIDFWVGVSMGAWIFWVFSWCDRPPRTAQFVWLLIEYDPCELGLYTVAGAFSTYAAASEALDSIEEIGRYEIEEFYLGKMVEHEPPKPPKPGDRPVDPMLEQFARDYIANEEGKPTQCNICYQLDDWHTTTCPRNPTNG